MVLNHTDTGERTAAAVVVLFSFVPAVEPSGLPEGEREQLRRVRPDRRRVLIA